MSTYTLSYSLFDQQWCETLVAPDSRSAIAFARIDAALAFRRAKAVSGVCDVFAGRSNVGERLGQWKFQGLTGAMTWRGEGGRS